MKRLQYLLLLFTLGLAACGGVQKPSGVSDSLSDTLGDSIDPVDSRQAVVEAQSEDLTFKPQIAYVKAGRLFAYDVRSNRTVEVKALGSKAFNCVFMGPVLFATTDEGSELALHSVQFVEGEEPHASEYCRFEVRKEQCMIPYGPEPCRLRYLEVGDEQSAEIVLPYEYSEERYSFNLAVAYNFAAGIVRTYDSQEWIAYEVEASTPDFEWDYTPVLSVPMEESEHGALYMNAADQLVFNGAVISDRLDLKVKGLEHPTFVNARYPYDYSPNPTRVLFGVVLASSDIAHGPVCVASLDGSEQRVILEDGVAESDQVRWAGKHIAYIESRFDEEKGGISKTLWVINGHGKKLAKVVANPDYWCSME
ncbi:MAG: hypothetical protein CSA97_04975 [Bacteroidetes bacterium]|nr:MAG: hypothetical protein CSA97_04975 [Bacteroidota bacterium]